MTSEEYSDLVRKQGIENYFVFPRIKELQKEFTDWYLKQPFVSDIKNSLDAQNPDFSKYENNLDKDGSSCYINAQRILKLDKENKYFYNEGFYWATWTPVYNGVPCPMTTEIALHAFNSLDKKIMDFESALKKSVTCFNYYGIHIPKETVEHLLNIKHDGANILEIRSATSLVIPFFLTSTNREDWLKPGSSYFIPADCVKA